MLGQYLAGSVSFNPKYLVNVNNILYFAATDGNGTELWKSDGSPAGTKLAADIYPGASSSSPALLTNVNGILYFTASSSTNSLYLWKYSPATGVVLVDQTPPDGPLTSVGSAVYYRELVTDGLGHLMVSDTSGGASMLTTPVTNPSGLVNLNGTLFFSGSDTAHGNELWKCKGYLASLVADIRPGSAGSNPASLASSGGVAYFTADDGVHGNQLWKSDGSAAGTVMVKTIYDGNAASSPKFSAVMNGMLYFSATNATYGNELWKSDGSADGTVMVKDIRPGSGGSVQMPGLAIGGTLYFAGDDGTGSRLWKTDGTASGTAMLPDPANALNPYGLTDVNGTLYFASSNGGYYSYLWKTDGTSAGTAMLLSGPQLDDLYNVNSRLFFGYSNYGRYETPWGSGWEFWTSDGTDAQSGGTALLKDICPGSCGSGPTLSITRINDTLYFSASDPIHGAELWKSDGTAAGTVLVKDIAAGSAGSFPSNFTLMNGVVYFMANDGIHGTELWKTDGTEAGTVMVKDISAGSAGSYPSEFAVVNGTLYFKAMDGVHGSNYTLWKSDGTEAGTVMVKNIITTRLTAVNDTLYLIGNDKVHGAELWQSDGTDAGTVMVTDIWPGSGSSDPHILANINGTMFFSADDGVHGVELWALATLPTLAVAPANLDFGLTPLNVPVGALLTLSNPGSAPLTVTAPMSILDGDSALFSVIPGGPDPCPSLTPSIPAGGSCTLSLSFTPTAPGNRSASLHIGSTSPPSKSLEVPLTGGVTLPSLTLALNFSGPGTGSVSIAPTPPGLACSTSCGQAFLQGTTVSLTPAPDAGSYFASWNGCDQVVSDTCSAAMSTGRSVTADFQIDWPVMMGMPAVGHDGDLQGAYDSQSAGSTLFRLKRRDFSGDLACDNEVQLSLQGGCNADLSDCGGTTYLTGRLAVRAGTVKIGNLCFR